MMRGREQVTTTGFTLIELLVVVGIVTMLIALMVPALVSSKERARRRVCMAHVRQFIVACHLYANDDVKRLPAGEQYTPFMLAEPRNRLAVCAGDKAVLSCPWLRAPFDGEDGWYDEEGQGYVLGYNYLGGHLETPWEPINDGCIWLSPQSTGDKGSMPLVTELNAWSIAHDKTFAPHGPWGAIMRGNDATNEGLGGISSKEIGAIGGNVGLLDGSVSWKHISDMKVYQGYVGGDQTSCITMW